MRCVFGGLVRTRWFRRLSFQRSKVAPHHPRWNSDFGAGDCALPIKRKVTPQQWALELEPHLLGTDGPWDWDDATSVALADQKLEAVRGRLPKFDLLTTEERRREFESIIAALKRGEIPEVSDD